MIRRSRILFYNWAPFDDPDLNGGGVTIYLQNLLMELSKRKDLEIFFLSSGMRRNWFSSKVFCRETANVLSGSGVRSFEIWNSPVRVPGRRMAHKIDCWQSEPLTKREFARFLAQHGPFDVVHIHNLEGISSEVLRLKQQFPNCRFFFTWHNYIPLCSQVHLLFRDSEPCLDYADGMRCVDCVGHGSISDRIVSTFFHSARRKQPNTARAAKYKSWRKTNAELLSSGVDGTIAVSDLAKMAVTSLGVDPNTVSVLPLGMDLSASCEDMISAWHQKPRHQRFTFSFAGYAEAYKGLPFMVDALESAQSAFLRHNADLLVLADLRKATTDLKERIRALFHTVTFVDGYRREDLRRYARLIDINVIPSIWQETFGQIGYEMLCYGTPSLLSTSVGLGMFYEEKDQFIFTSNDHADLVRRMTELARNPKMLREFWDKPIELPTIASHAEALLRVIRSPEP